MPDTTPAPWAGRIRELFEKRGLTITEAADAPAGPGWSPSTLYSWVRTGPRPPARPRPPSLTRWLQAIGATPEEARIVAEAAGYHLVDGVVTGTVPEPVDASPAGLIRTMLRSRKMGAAKLAVRLGMPRRTVQSRLRTGHVPPEWVPQVCDALVALDTERQALAAAVVAETAARVGGGA